jgi:hypothetical protein
LRRRPAVEELDKTPLNITSTQPAISRDKILLVAATHETSNDPEEIWQSWGQPEIWRLPHGHISTFLKPGLIGRMIGWGAPRLEACQTNA